MKEGPPATICGGRWLRGQFSMLIMDSLLHRASSNGRLCRLGLSLRYSSSKFSSVPRMEGRMERGMDGGVDGGYRSVIFYLEAQIARSSAGTYSNS